MSNADYNSELFDRDVHIADFIDWVRPMSRTPKHEEFTPHCAPLETAPGVCERTMHRTWTETALRETIELKGPLMRQLARGWFIVRLAKMDSVGRCAHRD